MKGTSKTAKKDGDYLSTLARGLSVLRAFTKERPEMTLSETAAATQLSPAVARRCLHTLVELGYVGKAWFAGRGCADRHRQVVLTV